MQITTRWFVETPEYPVREYVEHMLAQIYDIADCVEVDAPTRREAVSIAVKGWLAERGENYCKTQRQDGLNPFTGVRARSDAEVKAATKAAGPPEHAPDWCDTCSESHPIAIGAGRWVWLDDGIDEDLRWGWFGTCVLAAVSETEDTQ